MLSGHLIAFGIIGLATRLKGASSCWSVKQHGFGQLPLDGALSSQGIGGFLILEYQKSSAPYTLTTQLWARERFLTANMTVHTLTERAQQTKHTKAKYAS